MIPLLPHPILNVYSFDVFLFTDNDHATYVPFQGEAVDELEVSFLSNVKQNFDPGRCTQSFSLCLLPKLKEQLTLRTLGNKNFNKSFVFQCNMEHPATTGIIRSMQQLTFDFEKSSMFPRTARRLIDNRDCIEFLYRDSSTFGKVCTLCTLSTLYMLCRFVYLSQ